MPRRDPALEHVSSTLTGMVGSILQVSDRKARIAFGAGAKVAASATTAGTVTTLVGSFGAASTGTAIATLTGAAKTSATLYWIGGLVGGGVATGGALLVVGTAGASIYAAHRMQRAVFGGSRSERALSEVEHRVLASIAALKSAVDAALAEDREITAEERRLFARIGLAPLVSEVEGALRTDTFTPLTRYHRIRLRGQVHVLRTLQSEMEAQ